ncbi:MAG: hypothetical protein HYR63_18405 [Proteobacteria bacterium]|nr:hypothetical protein [Pseudomonadota bacterium]MBI3499492.1 hypothetical protein [Pseudomonadota bacterium]
MPQIPRTALLNALGTALTVAVIATVLFYTGQTRRGPSPLVPIAILMVGVFSAALTGTLIFGRPMLWYLEGKKREALALLAYTLAFLFVLAAIALAALVFLAPIRP